MEPSFRQVRAFVAAARLGGFTRAAEALRVSQPTLTVQVRQLEEALGLRLLDRTSQGVEATPVGRDLLPGFERLLGDLDALVAGARETAALRSGVVRLAVLPSVGATVVPAALAHLRTGHPGIRAVVRDAVARRVRALVKAGVAELGIGTDGDPDPELDVRPLLEDRMVAVLPAGHPLAASEAVSPRVLASVPLILTDPDSSVRALVDRAFAAAGLQVSPEYEATDMSTAVAMVRADLGVAVLPSTAVDLRVEPGLETRPVGEPPIRRSVVLIRKAGRSLSPAAEAFVAALAAEIS